MSSFVSRALLSALLAGVAGPALAQDVALPDVPAAIKPGDLKAYLKVPATGVQVYLCSKPEGGTWTWVFRAPEAGLFDAAGARLGKHYGGPTWEGADGGKVVGAVKASAPAPGGNAIPWLLLDIKSREGTGAFTQAAGILRVNTVGGQAPAAGCDETRAGAELRVLYTANYYFLK
jgi:hypothetical protein